MGNLLKISENRNKKIESYFNEVGANFKSFKLIALTNDRIIFFYEDETFQIVNKNIPKDIKLLDYLISDDFMNKNYYEILMQKP